MLQAGPRAEAAPKTGVQPTATGEALALGWENPTGILRLSVINFVLRIVTLGIHHFWGKTEVRRRLWSATRINGEPLLYTGTGGELFRGFLIVVAVIFVPLLAGAIAVALLFGNDPTAIAVFQITIFSLFFVLTGVGIWTAQRYRLSRTEWRGIRGGMAGSPWRYAWTYIWTALLIPFTLGWIVPWRAALLQRTLVSDMRFGNRPFAFTGNAGPLYGRFAILWLGTILAYAGAAVTIMALLLPTISRYYELGIPVQLSAFEIAAVLGTLVVAGFVVALSSAWYLAGQINHFARHTHFEGATFRATATGGSMLWLTLTNILLITLTLGLLTPVAQMRLARYMVTRMAIDGAVPLGDILQNADRGPRRGEGLAEMFDIDGV